MFESVVVSPRRSRFGRRALAVAAVAHVALVVSLFAVSVWAVDDLVPPDERVVILVPGAAIPVDFTPPPAGGPRTPPAQAPVKQKEKAPDAVQQPEVVLPAPTPASPETPVSDPGVTDPGPPSSETGPGVPGGVPGGPSGPGGPGGGGPDVGPGTDKPPTVYDPSAVDVVPAKTKDCRDPVYPAIAKALRLQGTVVLEAVVTPEGQVVSIEKLSGDDRLAVAAVEALERCRFTPARLHGHAVAARLVWTVNFTLR